MASFRQRLVNYPYKVIKYTSQNRLFVTPVLAFISSLLIFIFIFKLTTNLPTQKQLIIGATGNVLYLNPVIQTANLNELLINSVIYDSLVEPSVNGEILPGVAKTWSISADGKKYTFIIRQDIKWHDNTNLTAKDVKATLEKIKNSKQNTAIVKALQDVNIKEVSPYMLEFTLKQPNSTFLELLNIFIAKETNLSNYPYAKLLEEPEIYTVTGTGPYKLETKKVDSLTLVANKKYFRGSPKINTLQFKFFDSQKRLRLSYIANEISLFLSNNPQVYKQFEKQKDTNIATFNLAYYTRVLYFNMTNKNSPTTNLSFRKAILYSINKSKLIQNYPGAQIANGPYNEFSWAYSSDMSAPFDQQKAKEFLKECKNQLKKDCTNVTLTYASNKTNDLVVNNIKNQLKEVGINLKLRPMSTQDILEQILPNRDFEILYFGIQSTIDPDQYNLWHSSQIKYPGLNISGLKSKRIDYYLEQARITTNKLKRQKLYLDFQKELAKYTPVVYLFNPPVYVISKNYIKIPVTNQYIISEQQLFKTIYLWDLK